MLVRRAACAHGRSGKHGARAGLQERRTGSHCCALGGCYSSYGYSGARPLRRASSSTSNFHIGAFCHDSTGREGCVYPTSNVTSMASSMIPSSMIPSGCAPIRSGTVATAWPFSSTRRAHGATCRCSMVPSSIATGMPSGKLALRGAGLGVDGRDRHPWAAFRYLREAVRPGAAGRGEDDARPRSGCAPGTQHARAAARLIAAARLLSVQHASRPRCLE